MSDQTPYEKLGVDESASFEEIQGIRDRLLREYSDDPKKCAEVEASYDSVLMQRLKLRQEGKIKVPDGIRFAEKTSSSFPKLSMPSLPNTGGWLAGSFAAPSLVEWGIPTGIALALGTIVAMNPSPATVQFVAAMATGSALYGIYRKERSLGRSVLFGLGGLIGGYLLGVGLWGLLPSSLQAAIPGDGRQALDVFVTWSVCAVLWLVALFVK
jgi:Protein CHAPERONE-LIKE PROTEIN OF POR1-like